MKKTNLLFIFALFFIIDSAFAQTIRKVVTIPVNKKVVVTTKDDSRYIGILSSKTGENLTLITETDTVFIPKNTLQDMTIFTDDFANPSPDNKMLNSSRQKNANAYYAILPSAIPQEKGTISYRNIMFLGNHFTFAPSEKLTTSFGMPLPLLFLLAEEGLGGAIRLTPVWYNARYNVIENKQGWNIGVGINGCRTPLLNDDFDAIKLFYTSATATYRNEAGSMSINAGIGRDKSFGDNSRSHYIGLSGVTHIGKGKHYLAGELVYSYFIDESPLTLLLASYRRTNSKNTVSDIGLGLVYDEFETLSPFPYVSWSKFF